MRIAVVAIAAAFSATKGAAQLNFDVRPGFLEGNDNTFGLRYALELPSGKTYGSGGKIATAFAYAADIIGAAALKSATTTEPLARGHAEFGLRMQRAITVGCPPPMTDCPPPTDVDIGYFLIGAEVDGEAGQKFDEVEGSLGVTLLYRSPRTARGGIWPLVPSVEFDLELAKPMRSEVRDTLDARGRVSFALLWDRLQLINGPEALTRLRFDAEWRRYMDLEDAELGIPERGTFIAFGASYEMTGWLPYFRGLSVRWSEGEHPTQFEERKAWLIGLAFGTTR